MRLFSYNFSTLLQHKERKELAGEMWSRTWMCWNRGSGVLQQFQGQGWFQSREWWDRAVTARVCSTAAIQGVRKVTLPFLRATRSISFPLRSNLCTFRLPSADKSRHQTGHILFLCSPESSLSASHTPTPCRHLATPTGLQLKHCREWIAQKVYSSSCDHQMDLFSQPVPPHQCFAWIDSSKWVELKEISYK